MPTTVYYASNRRLTGPATDPASYAADIQQPLDPITYGTAFVTGIDVASNTQGAITLLENTTTGGFSAEAIGDLGQAGRDLLVFIHGFDNTFSDAITWGAFNREWIAGSGATSADTAIIAFSWPSRGKIVDFPILQADYLHDRDMAKASGPALMRFFANLLPIVTTARGNGQRIFLLAHSMGNWALQNAVATWFAQGQGNADLFDLAILAAGDCGFDAFATGQGLDNLTNLARRVAIYASEADDVLKLSEGVNLEKRLGQDGPRNASDPTAFPATKYQLVDATSFDDYHRTFLTSHQYYRWSPTARTCITTEMSA